MPPRDDKNGTASNKEKLGDSVPVDPQSFSPHVSDAAIPNAWESLRALTDRQPGTSFQVDEMLALARSRIKGRALRYNYLPKPMFGEPAWDMLLMLYVSTRSGTRESVKMLSLSSGAPATTALRWIDYLGREGLITRKANPVDLRVVFVELTDKGRDAIEAYFTELLEKEKRSRSRL